MGRAVIGRYCSNLSRGPPPGKFCVSLTYLGRSSTATERRYQQGPSLSAEVLTGVGMPVVHTPPPCAVKRRRTQ